jgi:hypothetical protein
VHTCACPKSSAARFVTPGLALFVKVLRSMPNPFWDVSFRGAWPALARCTFCCFLQHLLMVQSYARVRVLSIFGQLAAIQF